jgi:hypothetical protein
MAARLIRVPILARALLRAFGVSPGGTLQIRTDSRGDVSIEPRRVYGEDELNAMSPIRVLDEEPPTA